MTQSLLRRYLPLGVCLPTLLSSLAGCAQIIVTRDGAGNTTNVKIEPGIFKPPGQPPNTAAQSSSITQMETAVHKGINQQRQKHGLPPLKIDTTLSKVARDYSRRMSVEKFFSHYDAQGKSAADRVRAAGKTYSAVGENLFTSTNAPDPVAASVQGWMKSKGHRENILNKTFTHTGIGIWKNGNTYHFTQLFFRPL